MSPDTENLPTIVASIICDMKARGELLALAEARMRTTLDQCFALGGLPLVDSLIASARAPYIGRFPDVRWSVPRKVALLNAIHRGDITIDECHSLLGLSPEEIAEWRSRYERFGSEGLCSTKLQRVGR